MTLLHWVMRVYLGFPGGCNGLGVAACAASGGIRGHSIHLLHMLLAAFVSAQEFLTVLLSCAVVVSRLPLGIVAMSEVLQSNLHA